MKSYLQAAKEYHAAGLKVIPFTNGPDGGKIFPRDYAKYRDAQTPDDIDRLFSVSSDGICLLCTDGIEAVDIDTKHDERGTIVDDLCTAIDDFGFNMPRIVQKTKSGGLHIIYRCPNPDGNRKLAKRKGSSEAVIETRGKGGLLFVWPTPGYDFLNNGSLLDIPAVTQQERDNLIALCQHLDETEPERFETKIVKKEGRELTGVTPWDAFDQSTDILEMMVGYGWRVIGQRGEYVRLNRPGAKNSRGVDGTVIQNHNLFYPFTSSDEFTPNKGYSPSSVFAIKEHRGDFSAAARELYLQGFGDRIAKKSAAEQETKQEQIQKQLPDLIARAGATRFDIFKKVEEIKPLLVFNSDKRYPVAGRGMLGVFIGHEKSGKSFVLSCIEAAGIGGKNEILNFSLDLDGGCMLHFDTEQSAYFYDLTQRRIHRLATVAGNARNYAAYHLRQFQPMERMEIIEHFIYNTPGLSIVIIDGYVDLTDDYNNLEKTQAFVNRLLKWTDERKVLILGVLHVNKGDGKVRGHLGSELKNKCDFIVSVTQYESGKYNLKNPTGRFPNFPDMEFTRDSEGLPIYDQGQIIETNIPIQPPAAAFAAPPRNTMNEDEIPF